MALDGEDAVEGVRVDGAEAELDKAAAGDGVVVDDDDVAVKVNVDGWGGI